MNTIQKLHDCFRQALALPVGTAIEGLAYQDHPSWDSVAHMRLIAAIETAFDLMLDTDEILEMSSYDKTVELLARHDIALAA